MLAAVWAEKLFREAWGFSSSGSSWVVALVYTCSAWGVKFGTFAKDLYSNYSCEFGAHWCTHCDVYLHGGRAHPHTQLREHTQNYAHT